MKLLKLIPDNTNIKFLRWRVPFYAISVLLMAASLALVFTKGLNLGVDFVGGQSIRVAFVEQTAPVAQVREEINALDAGFSRALATILDSNITTFIAAAILFYIGTGPVRGFAVTLGIGIITTVFTAFTLTRLIVATWFRWWRPRTIPI